MGPVGAGGAPGRRHRLPDGRREDHCTASSRSAGSSPPRAAAGSPTRGSSPSRTARRSSTTAPRPGVGRMPFAVWILDNVGAFGVKRLKADRRRAIPGVLAYCRKVFEKQVPFDYSFDLDDSALYCLEMTEKAFRSQGLALSEPVRLGDMENANRYPICISLFVSLSPQFLEEAPDAGAGRLHARQRAARDVGVAAPGDGLSAPGRSHHRGRPRPARRIQPGRRSRDRRGHRARIPDERQAAVATGGPVRPRFARIQGRGRRPPPARRPRPAPPRHRGPGGQLLRRVPVLLARSEDGPELDRDPVPDPRPRLRPPRHVRSGLAARSGLRVQLGACGRDDRRPDRDRPAYRAGRPGRTRRRAAWSSS